MIRPMHDNDISAVLSIYQQGIDTNLATFTASCPSKKSWCASHDKRCRLVYEQQGEVTAFAALIAHGGAPAYAGVMEVSLYVSGAHRGKGIGEALLDALIKDSEREGIWTLESVITADNTPSVRLHEKLGFRLVGRREKISYTPDGVWHDTLVYERRSPRVRAAEPYRPAPKDDALVFRLATKKDLPIIMDMFAQARAFMRQSGNLAQWTHGYPSHDILLHDIALDALTLCERAGQPAAVFALHGHDKTYDVIYQGAWRSDKPYKTVHRIATIVHNAGVASACLNYAKKGAPAVRVDTHRDNVPMQKLLEKNGFVYCGIIHLASGDERLAYEWVRP